MESVRALPLVCLDATAPFFSPSGSCPLLPLACRPAGGQAVLGQVELSSLPPDHWLLHRPMDVSPPRAEFGWSATPLPQALGEYMQYLRAAH